MNEVLCSFRTCFTRTTAFEWFAVLVVGLMVRSDHLGVTSIIRDLALDPRHYESMIHFFRSSAWSLESLRRTWLEAVRRFALLLYVRGRVVLVGDGMKQAKEGRHMPGVKRLHQESENVSKSEYIFGHLFGAIGILAGTPQKWFCLPLSMNLQDGVKAIFGWAGDAEERQNSHVVQMIDQAFAAARTFGRALLLLDRYFLSIPALQRLAERNPAIDGPLHIVTKAKMNAVAYEKPESKKPSRGRPPKKGKMVKLAELFQTRAAEFQTAAVTIYGKEETASFLCLDLLWGQGLYEELRFVLVRRRPPFDSRQHGSDAGRDGDHRVVRIPVQDRMHVSGNEASDRRIRLSLLERVNAQTEPLPSQRRDRSAGAGDKRVGSETNSVDPSGHRGLRDVQRHRDRHRTASRITLFRSYACTLHPLSSYAVQVHRVGGDGRGPLAPIDFSLVCSKPASIRNSNIKPQAMPGRTEQEVP
jgi:hypothetical protein